MDEHAPAPVPAAAHGEWQREAAGDLAPALPRLAGTLETVPELSDVAAGAWLLRDLTLLSISILLALGGGLAWFVLDQWLRLVDRARSDVLGLEVTYPAKGELRDD